jgi:hypothetical protein
MARRERYREGRLIDWLGRALRRGDKARCGAARAGQYSGWDDDAFRWQPPAGMVMNCRRQCARSRKEWGGLKSQHREKGHQATERDSNRLCKKKRPRGLSHTFCCRLSYSMDLRRKNKHTYIQLEERGPAWRESKRRRCITMLYLFMCLQRVSCTRQASPAQAQVEVSPATPTAFRRVHETSKRYVSWMGEDRGRDM